MVGAPRLFRRAKHPDDGVEDDAGRQQPAEQRFNRRARGVRQSCPTTCAVGFAERGDTIDRPVSGSTPESIRSQRIDIAEGSPGDRPRSAFSRLRRRREVVCPLARGRWESSAPDRPSPRAVEWGVRFLLDAQVHVPRRRYSGRVLRSIAPGSSPGLEQNLETVADCQAPAPPRLGERPATAGHHG